MLSKWYNTLKTYASLMLCIAFIAAFFGITDLIWRVLFR